MAREAAMSDEAEDIPADEPAGQSAGEFRGRAERVRPVWAGRIGTVSQAATELQGMREGVDPVDAVVADVQGTATVGPAVSLDVKDQAMKHRISRPAETPGCPSWLLTRFLVSLPRKGGLV